MPCGGRLVLRQGARPGEERAEPLQEPRGRDPATDELPKAWRGGERGVVLGAAEDQAPHLRGLSVKGPS